MVTEEKLRGRFEEWCKEFGYDITRNERNPEEYCWRDTEMAWLAWQAAEAAGFARARKEVDRVVMIMGIYCNDFIPHENLQQMRKEIENV